MMTTTAARVDSASASECKPQPQRGSPAASRCLEGASSVPDGADHRSAPTCRVDSIAVTCPHGPGGSVVIPGRLGNLGFPQHMAADVGTCPSRFGSRPAVRAARQRSASIGRSARSCSGRSNFHVDAGTGIGVLPPGPADAGVLLDDRERDTRLFQPNARQQTGFPAADDDHREVVGGGTPDRSTVFAVEFHLLEQHRPYSGGTGSQTSHCIISCNNSGPIGSGSGQPRSR